jgi:hypothetical protein
MATDHNRRQILRSAVGAPLVLALPALPAGDPWDEAIRPAFRSPAMADAVGHARAAGLHPDDLCAILYPNKPNVSLCFLSGSFNAKGRM